MPVIDSGTASCLPRMSQTIPGVARDTAQRLLAELVGNMSRLPAAVHLNHAASPFSHVEQSL
jgi:hypothetical protein